MLSNIQILRAIAAILVVAAHTVQAAKSYNLSTDFFYKIDVWGQAGVDIFFIISGFIMVYIQINKEKKPLDFLRDRVERIVPLYWFLTITISLIMLIFPQIFRLSSFDIKHLIDSLFFINYLDSIGIPLTDEHLPVLYLGWTLEYEMLFYIIFGLSIFFKKINYSIGISIIILSFMVFFGLNSIIIEFIYGMIVGLIFNKFKINLNNIVCLILILLGGFLLIIDWAGLPRNLTWGSASLLIFLGFLYLKPINNSLFHTLGNASYSIYLIQVFSIPLCHKIFIKIGSLNFIYNNELYVIFCIIISIISGVLLHFTVEKPLAKLIKKWKQQNKEQKVVV